MRVVAIVTPVPAGLTAKLRARLEQALPGNVRFTASLDEARTTIRAEVRRGVDLVMLGGGDGTVVMGLTLIGEACRGVRQARADDRGVAHGLGQRDRRYGRGERRRDRRISARLSRGAGTRRTLPLLEVLGVRAPFVGMGVDAQLLEDQAAVGRVVDRLPGARFVGGAARYALSVALRSVPRFAIGTRPNAIVTNLGAPRDRDDASPARPGARARGEELWRGQCTLVAGATIPYFGFGLKMFAFAEIAQRRIPLAVWRCRSIRDHASIRRRRFAASTSAITCTTSRAIASRSSSIASAAIEAGGELFGRRTRVELALGTPIDGARVACRGRR